MFKCLYAGLVLVLRNLQVSLGSAEDQFGLKTAVKPFLVLPEFFTGSSPGLSQPFNHELRLISGKCLVSWRVLKPLIGKKIVDGCKNCSRFAKISLK